MYIGRLLTPKQNLLGACFTLSANRRPLSQCTAPVHTHTRTTYIPAAQT